MSKNYNDDERITKWHKAKSTVTTINGTMSFLDWITKEGKRICKRNPGKKFYIAKHGGFIALFIQFRASVEELASDGLCDKRPDSI